MTVRQRDSDCVRRYVHRVGRTGRAGRTGKATALFVPGNEPKTGNGPLWHQIQTLIDESKQTTPEWFGECKPPPKQKQNFLFRPKQPKPAATTPPPSKHKRR